MTVELVTELDEIADVIRAEQAKGRAGLEQALDSHFAIGHCLLAARRELPSNQAFGAWMAAEAFGFTRQWANRLCQAAEHEPAVRTTLESQLSNGRPNLEKAVKRVLALNAGGRDRHSVGVGLGHQSDDPDDTETPLTFPTVVVDPPWRYDNVATRGAAEDHYPTMSLAELAELDIPSAVDGHVYLWVTNAFLADGFDLLDAWDYRYKTTLTWCKPQIGLGNYFRNNTEHVLFGVRGSAPTNANDIGTWFLADRTQHSAKPESFYDIVERSSPGPFLEMFARRRRFGWHTWGDEA